MARKVLSLLNILLQTVAIALSTPETGYTEPWLWVKDQDKFYISKCTEFHVSAMDDCLTKFSPHLCTAAYNRLFGCTSPNPCDYAGRNYCTQQDEALNHCSNRTLFPDPAAGCVQLDYTAWSELEGFTLLGTSHNCINIFREKSDRMRDYMGEQQLVFQDRCGTPGVNLLHIQHEEASCVFQAHAHPDWAIQTGEKIHEVKCTMETPKVEPESLKPVLTTIIDFKKENDISETNRLMEEDNLKELTCESAIWDDFCTVLEVTGTVEKPKSILLHSLTMDEEYCHLSNSPSSSLSIYSCCPTRPGSYKTTGLRVSCQVNYNPRMACLNPCKSGKCDFHPESSDVLQWQICKYTGHSLWLYQISLFMGIFSSMVWAILWVGLRSRKYKELDMKSKGKISATGTRLNTLLRCAVKLLLVPIFFLLTCVKYLLSRLNNKKNGGHKAGFLTMYWMIQSSLDPAAAFEDYEFETTTHDFPETKPPLIPPSKVGMHIGVSASVMLLTIVLMVFVIYSICRKRRKYAELKRIIHGGMLAGSIPLACAREPYINTETVAVMTDFTALLLVIGLLALAITWFVYKFRLTVLTRVLKNVSYNKTEAEPLLTANQSYWNSAATTQFFQESRRANLNRSNSETGDSCDLQDETVILHPETLATVQYMCNKGVCSRDFPNIRTRPEDPVYDINLYSNRKRLEPNKALLLTVAVLSLCCLSTAKPCGEIPDVRSPEPLKALLEYRSPKCPLYHEEPQVDFLFSMINKDSSRVTTRKAPASTTTLITLTKSGDQEIVQFSCTSRITGIVQAQAVARFYPYSSCKSVAGTMCSIDTVKPVLWTDDEDSDICVNSDQDGGYWCVTSLESSLLHLALQVSVHSALDLTEFELHQQCFPSKESIVHLGRSLKEINISNGAVSDGLALPISIASYLLLGWLLQLAQVMSTRDFFAYSACYGLFMLGTITGRLWVSADLISVNDVLVPKCTGQICRLSGGIEVTLASNTRKYTLDLKDNRNDTVYLQIIIDDPHTVCNGHSILYSPDDVGFYTRHMRYCADDVRAIGLKDKITEAYAELDSSHTGGSHMHIECFDTIGGVPGGCAHLGPAPACHGALFQGKDHRFIKFKRLKCGINKRVRVFLSRELTQVKGRSICLYEEKLYGHTGLADDCVDSARLSLPEKKEYCCETPTGRKCYPLSPCENCVMPSETSPPCPRTLSSQTGTADEICRLLGERDGKRIYDCLNATILTLPEDSYTLNRHGETVPHSGKNEGLLIIKGEDTGKFRRITGYECKVCKQVETPYNYSADTWSENNHFQLHVDGYVKPTNLPEVFWWDQKNWEPIVTSGSCSLDSIVTWGMPMGNQHMHVARSCFNVKAIGLDGSRTLLLTHKNYVKLHTRRVTAWVNKIFKAQVTPQGKKLIAQFHDMDFLEESDYAGHIKITLNLTDLEVATRQVASTTVKVNCITGFHCDRCKPHLGILYSAECMVARPVSNFGGIFKETIGILCGGPHMLYSDRHPDKYQGETPGCTIELQRVMDMGQWEVESPRVIVNGTPGVHQTSLWSLGHEISEGLTGFTGDLGTQLSALTGFAITGSIVIVVFITLLSVLIILIRRRMKKDPEFSEQFHRGTQKLREDFKSQFRRVPVDIKPDEEEYVMVPEGGRGRKNRRQYSYEP